MQDVEIGDAFFDDGFIVQASSEDVVKRLLTNTNIRQLIQDKQRLKDVFDLFSLVLDELCKLGSAYEGDPKIKLT